MAALVYRRHDLEALAQFARRLAFMVLIGNGDGHLKNWSLIYRNPRRPTLSPAYDLVATAPYRADGDAEDLGLKFFKSRRFRHVHVRLFDRLAERLGAMDAHLAEQAADTVVRAWEQWPRFEEHLAGNPRLRQAITDGMRARARTLLGRGGR